MEQSGQLFKKRKFPTILFITLCLIGSFVCGLLGVALSDEEISFGGRVGCCSIGLVFLIGVFWGGSELFNSKAGISVTPEGFLDQSTRMTCGFVPWDNIQKIIVRTNKGHCYASFILRDPHQTIAQSSGPLSRAANTLYLHLAGTPVIINMQGYKCKPEDLLSHLESVYHQGEGIIFE